MACIVLPARARHVPEMNILSIDIGGSKVKCLLSGENEPRAIPSGPGLPAADMVHEARRAARGWKYDAVSIGYPGLVGDSGPLAEPGNLGPGWVGFDFAAAFDCPVKIVNDAGMQALGTYDGGRMLFLGLGTGVGSALIVDHVLIPLELGDLRLDEGLISELIGRRALE